MRNSRKHRYSHTRKMLKKLLRRGGSLSVEDGTVMGINPPSDKIDEVDSVPQFIRKEVWEDMSA